MGTSVGFTNTVDQYAPWKKGVAWWVVLIQGLLIAGIGAYAYFGTESAARVIVLGVGLYLVLTALWTIVQAMRGRDAGLSVFNLLAAGGGLVAGISVALPFLFNHREALAPSFFTFGIALIVIGILTLLSAFVERPEGGVVWTTLVRAILWLTLGGYLVWVLLQGMTELAFLRWIAIAFMVLGVILIIWSIVLNRQQAARKAAANPPANPPAPTDKDAAAA